MIYKKIFNGLCCMMLILLLASCNQRQSYSIIIPKGSPEYATLYLDDETFDINIVNGADPLVAAFGSKTYDVIVAPTNLGAKFYQSSGDYQLSASIVWGNLYLVSASPLSLSDLNQATIYTFGQNQTPDIILKYILEQHQLTPQLTYLSSSLEVSTQFLRDPYAIYLIAEPALSTLMFNQSSLNTIDLQAVYQALSGNESYPQASVFVKSSLSDQHVLNINDCIKQSISTILNKQSIQTTATRLNSTLDDDTLYESITRSHLMFQTGLDAKPYIEAYFTLITHQNAALIGTTLPNQSFYR